MTPRVQAATAAIEALPPLRDVIAKHGLLAKKNLGQNFLLDLNLTAKIARAGGDFSGMNVIEVGPGPGGLTRALLLTQAACVHAIERDDRCIAALQDVEKAAGGRLVLHADDALAVNYETLCPPPRALVANLPYNIATPLLTRWLKTQSVFESMTLMFQKEVAERIVALPRTKDYGRLSVLSQWLCYAQKMFDLPPAAFTPAPKVHSSIVHFRFRPRTDDVDIALMEKVTAAAFGQRRKMLRQSLKQIAGDKTERVLAAAGIPATARAEEADIAAFVRLASAFRGITA